MYRDKLEEQLTKLENLQKMCASEHPETAFAISDKILELAEAIDRYDKKHPAADKVPPDNKTVRVTPGGIEVNGKPIDRVIDFDCKPFAFGLVRIAMTFEVPSERCDIPESMIEYTVNR